MGFGFGGGASKPVRVCGRCRGLGVVVEKVGNHEQQKPCPKCNADKR